MARNKYPEKTIEQILEVASKLFVEQGYEKTTIQDIMNELKLSKGAIYHHFKSKEEILEAVINKRSMHTKEKLLDLAGTTQGRNAKEKLIKIMMATMEDKKHHSIDSVLISKIQDPAFVVAGMKSAVFDDAPTIKHLFNEGIKDGSIQTTHPEACAEIFSLLMNVWINPTLFQRNAVETEERLHFLKDLMQKLGADIITDELIDKVLKGYQSVNTYID